MNKTFRGKLASTDVLRIRLSTNNGLTGYKIVKFQVMTGSAVANVESANMVAVSSTESDATGVTRTAQNNVNFDDPTLLAAIDYRQHANEAYGISSNNVIFDDKIFNQDIYVTNQDITASAEPLNYYIELEQVKLSENEATVATLKDMRAGPPSIV